MSRLDDIKAELEAVTPGDGWLHRSGFTKPTADFITNAPATVTYLVAEVERMRQTLESLRDLKERCATSTSDDVYPIYAELREMDLRDEV